MKTVNLSDLTTRELLAALQSVPYYYYENDDGDADLLYVGKRFVEGGECVVVRAKRDEIRAALVGREHVPGKKEAKLLRQLKAKTGMSESQLRAHSTYGRQLVDVQHTVPRKILKSPAEIRWYQRLYGSSFADYFYVER